MVAAKLTVITNAGMARWVAGDTFQKIGTVRAKHSYVGSVSPRSICHQIAQLRQIIES